MKNDKNGPKPPISQHQNIFSGIMVYWSLIVISPVPVTGLNMIIRTNVRPHMMYLVPLVPGTGYTALASKTLDPHGFSCTVR